MRVDRDVIRSMRPKHSRMMREDACLTDCMVLQTKVPRAIEQCTSTVHLHIPLPRHGHRMSIHFSHHSWLVDWDENPLSNLGCRLGPSLVKGKRQASVKSGGFNLFQIGVPMRGPLCPEVAKMSWHSLGSSNTIPSVQATALSARGNW